MNQVTVRRNELIEKIKANRNDHRKVFEEALDIYRAAVVQELDIMLDDAKNGRNIRRAISMPEPQDHTKDYDREITMLEMEIEDTVTIDYHDFARFVMDDWEWKAQWRASTASYLATQGEGR